MPGRGPGAAEDGVGAVVLERRGSWPLVVGAVALVLAGAVALVAVASDEEASDDGAGPASTTTSPAAVTTATVVDADRPALRRLPGADQLPGPIWLLAGRSPTEGTLQVHRVDADGGRVVNAATGRVQEPGAPVRAVLVDGAVVWSNGDQVVRVDDELGLIPFTVGPGTAVFASSGDRVWTVDEAGTVVDLSLGSDRAAVEVGPTDGELVAPLSAQVFLVWSDGGIGLWTPGTEPSYVGDGLLATTPDRTVLTDARGGPALTVAQTLPFRVTASVPLDVEGVPVGDGALSPDGRRVAFHLARGGRIELAVAELDDGTTTTLGVFTDRAAPVWLDDECLVAIAAPTDGRRLVWLVAPGTGEPSIPLLDLDPARGWTLAAPAP